MNPCLVSQDGPAALEYVARLGTNEAVLVDETTLVEHALSALHVSIRPGR